MIVYFSSISENTKRFVEKLELPAQRIPLRKFDDNPLIVNSPFVLVVPTYGGGHESSTVPKQVVKFLNIEQNRSNLVGVIGMGNTNFGEHFCRAADIISFKTGAPVIQKVEIFGTPDDVKKAKEAICQITTS